MSSSNSFYKIKRADSNRGTQFLFISKGKQEIVKAVQYHYADELLGSPVFNVGFGNYNAATGEISDDVISNNGDAFRIFHTVLETVPLFFETYPHAMLSVRGSDSSDEFDMTCRMTCSRRCLNTCKKRHRRISIYRHYIDKNLETLGKEYQILGGSKIQGKRSIEKYQLYQRYDSIFLTLAPKFTI